jgi:lycopene cyclase domain-containing protein
VLAACLLVTAPLELLGARVYRRPRRLVRAVVPAMALFVAWDAVATARGTWGFSPRYVGRARVLGLPLEELAFFVVIPICALLTYEAVQVVAGRVGRRRG